MINNYSYDAKNVVPHVDTSFSSGAKKYNYNEIYAKGLTETNYTKDNRSTKHKSNIASIYSMTMGQNHHFKLVIGGLMADSSMVHDSLTTVTKNGKKTSEKGGYGEFLPIKNIAYKPIAIESTKLQFGIFADFPLIHKRKMGSIQITLLDNALNDYEMAVYKWFSGCHPTHEKDYNEGYVLPMGEIFKDAKYVEYRNDGKISKIYSFEVIPDGDVSVARSYENASLKEITFNVLIVSPIWVEDKDHLQYSLTTSAMIVSSH